jgi:hypothetical protein
MTSQMLDLNNRMVDLNNRMLTANEQLLRLGNKNFDDNATVKVVTILTLIYLPASLVSVSDIALPMSSPQNWNAYHNCRSTAENDSDCSIVCVWNELVQVR